MSNIFIVALADDHLPDEPVHDQSYPNAGYRRETAVGRADRYEPLPDGVMGTHTTP